MMTPVDVLKPVPLRATAWPGFAEGNAAFAGVPLNATPTMPVNDVTSGALVPPAVATLIGPNEPAFSGTVRLTVSFATLVLNTSGPLFGLESMTVVVPKLYA